jgi:hypothetical protein
MKSTDGQKVKPHSMKNLKNNNNKESTTTKTVEIEETEEIVEIEAIEATGNKYGTVNNNKVLKLAQSTTSHSQACLNCKEKTLG